MALNFMFKKFVAVVVVVVLKEVVRLICKKYLSVTTCKLSEGRSSNYCKALGRHK